MLRRAVVLGGGGVTGVAWEVGLLLGLAEAGQGPYFDQLYDAHQNYLVQHDYDPILAEAGRMGYEARELIAEHAREKIRSLLNEEDFRERLAADM